MEGSIYTVDEVSDLLGIPRPTLYRYLREYAIPHLRRAGRIQIPEDSFDRIREARDLHKEGLGTDSVRRQLREGGGPDTGELDRRLNNLHDTLEDLRGELRGRPATGEVALPPALRTVLARQSLMLSAMFNLTGMVEDLLFANGRPRKQPLEDLRVGPDDTVLLHADGRAGIPGTVLVGQAPVREAEATEVLPPARVPPQDGSSRFGSLGRRRRRGVLALLSALLLGLLLALFLPTLADDAKETAEGPAKDAGGGDARQAAGEQKPEEPARQEASPQEDAANEGEDDVAADASLASREASSGETNIQTSTTPDSPDGIPDVAGRPLEEAARSLSEAGFSVAAIRSEPSGEDPGTVLKTEPSAGTDSRPGAPVVLTMSGGPTGIVAASVSADAPANKVSSASASSSSSASASSTSASASISSASGSASASPTP
ncbi:MAG: PASTA domain-containing protein [Rubrobacter sp.]